MKLDRLHNLTDVQVLREYIKDIKRAIKSDDKVLTEGKRVVVTTEIIDDDDIGDKVTINQEAKSRFIEKAKSLGSFDDKLWVNQLLNGLKQVGVQGINNISEDEKPVTNKEIRELVTLLIDLIGG